jgi:D-arabinitol 4-dehydrogenase
LLRVGADQQTRIISFTVTEAGYYLDRNDCLDLTAAPVASDLASLGAGQPGSTIYGALVALLRARRDANAGPVSLLNCDNLRHNGDRVRDGLNQFLAALNDPDLAHWIEINTSCPNSMVDRITPRPSSVVRDRVRAKTGRDDAAAIMAEDFIQWVVEDNFCAGRPNWPAVGVQMVDDVVPFEDAKIRILNASHSCIAWAGTMLGYQFIHEGAQNPEIRQMAFDYITDDVMPCLAGSPIDLASYRDVVLSRFENSAIEDTNQRVAMDGFSKIPGFITPTVSQRLAANQSVESVAMLPALFLAFLQRWHQGLLPYEYEDQAMQPERAHAICSASDPVAALAGESALWGEIAGDPRLADAIRRACERVDSFLALQQH